MGRIAEIVDMLSGGEKIALVSDAGTPGISDPGVALVSEIRQHFKNGEVSIESVPGPSALVSALSISGIPTDQFVFLGFLPHKKGRETLFKKISEYVGEKITVVLYESPHRIMKTLESLSVHLSETDCRVTIARELTKIHESVIQGKPSEVLEYFKSNSDEVRGEWVVMVSQ
jgi:16S rRNA (cytidine1402-2'-O)-methyltransferase